MWKAHRGGAGVEESEESPHPYIFVLRNAVVPPDKGSGRINSCKVFSWNAKHPIVLSSIALGKEKRSERRGETLHVLHIANLLHKYTHFQYFRHKSSSFLRSIGCKVFV